MFKLASIACLLFSLANGLLAASAPAQPAYPSSDDSSDGPAMPSPSYCALLKSPKRYAGKLVRLHASWRFGFETSLLYDKGCSQPFHTWLGFADEKALCPKTKEMQSLLSRSDKEAEITAVGRLYGPGRYGHLGDYQFQFVVVCLEKVKVTASEMQER
jgi:hypothetical protein